MMEDAPKELSKHALYMREWRKNNPDYIQRSRERDAIALLSEDGRRKNREKANEWYRLNKDRGKTRTKNWKENNPDQARLNTRRAQAKRRARIKCVQVLPIDYDLVQKMSQGLCGICSKPIGGGSFHYDHIKPIAKGGQHSTDNLQIAHSRCNQMKFTKQDFRL